MATVNCSQHLFLDGRLHFHTETYGANGRPSKYWLSTIHIYDMMCVTCELFSLYTKMWICHVKVETPTGVVAIVIECRSIKSMSDFSSAQEKQKKTASNIALKKLKHMECI
jgi:hypothetical protein